MATSIAALYLEGQEVLYLDAHSAFYASRMNSDWIGGWIAQARKARGWTQDQLGERLGVTKANVSHWETGKHEPSFGQLLKIKDLTGQPLRDVSAALDWPLPRIRREQVTSLSQDQLDALQAGMVGILAAISPAHGASPSATGSAGKPQRLVA